MKRIALVTAIVGTLGLSACAEVGNNPDTGPALAGGALGVITASALDASPEWTVVAGLAGAAAGTVVARNQRQSTTCAYSRGDGTYYTAPCP